MSTFTLTCVRPVSNMKAHMAAYRTYLPAHPLPTHTHTQTQHRAHGLSPAPFLMPPYTGLVDYVAADYAWARAVMLLVRGGGWGVAGWG